MIYLFELSETYRTEIPVFAKNPDEAHRIFTEWYEKHNEDGSDETIHDLLDNGYEGRTIKRNEGISEEYFQRNISTYAVVLPEESSKPEEPKYHLHIRFADGSKAADFYDKTLREIGFKLATLGEKYYLFPDAGDGELVTENVPNFHIGETESVYTFWIYAVLKDQEETWYEYEDPDPIFRDVDPKTNENRNK